MLFHAPQLGDPERAVIDRIDEVREALRYQLTAQRSWVGLLRRVMLARAIRGSNSIEGYNVSLDDAVAAVAGRTVYGTAEEAIARSGVEGQERIWIWTWSGSPSFMPGDAPTCADGAIDSACLNTYIDPGTDPRTGPGTGPGTGLVPGRTTGTCPNGATNYPVCIIINPSLLFPPPASAPAPSPNITSWQVSPLLLRSGESTFVSWNATDVSDCAVSGTDGDSWSGTAGDRKQSSAILGQTTFSISCTALSGASPSTVSMSPKTVNIIPTYQER